MTVQGEPGSFLQDKVKLTLSNGRVLEVPVVAMIVKGDVAAVGATPTAVLRVGDAAPDFTATDSNGNTWKLSDLRGRKNVLLTFFPRCFTGGCAGHLASVQAALPALEKTQTQVLAVSVDPAAEQTAFAAKLSLQFPLLPDPERDLSMLYGAAQIKPIWPRANLFSSTKPASCAGSIPTFMSKRTAPMRSLRFTS